MEIVNLLLVIIFGITWSAFAEIFFQTPSPPRLANRESEALQSIVSAFERWRLENSPDYGPTFGIHLFDHHLVSYDYGIYQHRQIICRGFLASLAMINPEKLPHQDRLTYDVLEHSLVTYIDGVESFRNYGNLNPLNFLETSWFSILGLWTPIPNSELSFRAFLAVLHSWRVQGIQIETLMRRSIVFKRTYHDMSIKRLIPIIDSAMESVNSTENIRMTLEPYLAVLEESDRIPLTTRQDLENQIRYSITNIVYPGFLRMQRFLLNEYLPNCRKTPGVVEWDKDHSFYKAAINWHTSLPMSPEEIHELGLSEVKRIHKNMQKIIIRHGGTDKTSIVDFSRRLKADPSARAKSENDLLSRHQWLIEEVINPSLPRVFHAIDIPIAPIEVVPLGFDGPEGMYGSGNGTGRFFINTQRAEQRPLYTMLSLSLHEANPGHHLQFAMSLELSLPNFRRQPEYANTYAVPVMFPFHNAYVEGWALYAESLGYPEYLDVLKNDSDIFGVLSWEMFRACRLVIDSGMHYYNWSRDQSINFMHSNTGVDLADVSLEIDRYSTWPGQALGYKVGEIAIKRLRDEAIAALGSSFDIRDFHHAILENGPLPLKLLEREVRNWYNEKRASIGLNNTACRLGYDFSKMMFLIVAIFTFTGRYCR